jgi:hypothetical protein
MYVDSTMFPMFFRSCLLFAIQLTLPSHCYRLPKPTVAFAPGPPQSQYTRLVPWLTIKYILLHPANTRFFLLSSWWRLYRTTDQRADSACWGIWPRTLCKVPGTFSLCQNSFATSTNFDCLRCPDWTHKSVERLSARVSKLQPKKRWPSS